MKRVYLVMYENKDATLTRVLNIVDTFEKANELVESHKATYSPVKEEYNFWVENWEVK